MKTLQQIKNRIFDEQVELAKEDIRQGVDVHNAHLFTESQLDEIKETVEVEDFKEYVDFKWVWDAEELVENPLAPFDDDEDDCDCTDGEDGCACPDYEYDFEPDEDAEPMDIEFEIEMDDHYHAPIKTFLAIKDKVFAEDYEYHDIEEETCSCGCDCGKEVCEACGKKHEKVDEEVSPRSKGRAKIVFKRAKGKITKRKKCPQGMKIAGRRCLPQTGTQKASNRRMSIKLKRAKKAQGAAMKKKAARIGKITKARVKGRSRMNFSGTGDK